jgi:hypothetical protein
MYGSTVKVLSYESTFVLQYTVHTYTYVIINVVLSYFRTFVHIRHKRCTVHAYVYCTAVPLYEGTAVHVALHVNPHVERPLESFYC